MGYLKTLKDVNELVAEIDNLQKMLSFEYQKLWEEAESRISALPFDKFPIRPKSSYEMEYASIDLTSYQYNEFLEFLDFTVDLKSLKSVLRLCNIDRRVHQDESKGVVIFSGTSFYGGEVSSMEARIPSWVFECSIESLIHSVEDMIESFEQCDTVFQTMLKGDR